MMKQRLKEYGLEHLLEGIESLTPFKKELFFSEIEKYGLPLYEKQLRFFTQKKTACSLGSPLQIDYLVSGSNEIERGQDLLRGGKIASLLLAGGQGTRLGTNAPKGMLPITNVFEKTLFRLYFEKVAAACGFSHKRLRVAVMTSPHTHAQTVKYLEENHYFGNNPIDIELFMQSELPVLNEEKKWFLESPGKLATSPDGNGGALLELKASGIADRWAEEGVEYIHVVPIDNPLADPFDCAMVGHQEKRGADLCIKGIEKEQPQEKLGVLVGGKDSVRVMEYSELEDGERSRKSAEGKLYWRVAYAGLFSFHRDFLERLPDTMPWHIAKKKGHSIQGEVSVQKFETFIFDLFPYAKKAEVVLGHRIECFAPVKMKGDIEKVKKSLLLFDQRRFAKITGTALPKKKFELDPSFYYPSEDLLHSWKGRALPDEDYIYP